MTLTCFTLHWRTNTRSRSRSSASARLSCASWRGTPSGHRFCPKRRSARYWPSSDGVNIRHISNTYHTVPPSPIPLQNIESKGTGKFLPRKILHPKELDIKILHPKDLQAKSRPAPMPDASRLEPPRELQLTKWLSASGPENWPLATCIQRT